MKKPSFECYEEFKKNYTERSNAINGHNLSFERCEENQEFKPWCSNDIIAKETVFECFCATFNNTECWKSIFCLRVRMMYLPFKCQEDFHTKSSNASWRPFSAFERWLENWAYRSKYGIGVRTPKKKTRQNPNSTRTRTTKAYIYFLYGFMNDTPSFKKNLQLSRIEIHSS